MPMHASNSTPPASLLRRLQWSLAAGLAAVLLWAALAPLHYPTRERVLEFPRGAAVLRGQAGPAPLPAEVRLTLGVRDVLLLRNRDLAPHVFGQVLVLPGHVVRLPFEQTGDFPFACDAAPASKVLVRVLPQPDPGWSRLRWRLALLFEAVRELPVQGPGD
ncbi:MULTISPECIES: hypothetical protein [unclassified Massilia]|uniref:hypothetical protein n=1 Tax=unclassified Massilia TaxID=2609279 RepID=UPI000AB98CA3|nr:MULTISPECIES: hypothetical protein [unclassified Massilia]